MLALAACGSDDDASTAASGDGDRKLILLEMSFPCALNEIISQVCAGAEAAELPEGYELDIKTGTEIGDNTAFNNLIKTSLQLDPAGLVVFPAGPAAQTPVLNQACDQGVKVVILDSPAEGVKCEVARVGADHYELGAAMGKWLVDHPPASKEVGVVTQPPGQFESTDSRVKGFVDTVEAAGFEVVATVHTDLSLDKTRTQATNMLTAHPDIGAVFSANGPMGEGTSQALKGKDDILQLSLDYVPSYEPMVLDGTLDAVGHQHAYEEGKLAVETMVKALEGEEVPSEVYTELAVVDETNAKDQPKSGAAAR